MPFPLCSFLINIGSFRYLLKGFFPRMRPDMIVECCSTSKGTTAIAALERSITGMGDYMVPQFRRLGERLGAVATLIGSAKQQKHHVITTFYFSKQKTTWVVQANFFKLISQFSKRSLDVNLWIYSRRHAIHPPPPMNHYANLEDRIHVQKLPEILQGPQYSQSILQVYTKPGLDYISDFFQFPQTKGPIPYSLCNENSL